MQDNTSNIEIIEINGDYIQLFKYLLRLIEKNRDLILFTFFSIIKLRSKKVKVK